MPSFRAGFPLNIASQFLPPQFEELRDELDRVWNTIATAPPLQHWAARQATATFPAVNVYETDDAITVEAELPGLDAGDVEYVRGRIERHVELTDSARGRALLDRWSVEKERFVKVMPTDYKRALDELRKLAAQDQQAARQAEVKVNG